MSRLAPLAAAGLLVGALAAPGFAQQAHNYLNVRVQSKGETYTVEHAGDSLRYEVIGRLDHTANEGLAMFSLDLVYDGPALQRAKLPTAAPMNRFSTPLGVSNPEGFGGTREGGNLLQVGGMQNTIRNQFAPQPTGDVITGVGHADQTLVVGRVRAPTTLGVYHLDVENLTANVIRQGETGLPFYACDPAFPGQVIGLTIEVVPLDVPVEPFTASGGGRLPIGLNAGPENAGREYWIFGSIVDEGFEGGVSIAGLELPVRDDAYFRQTLARSSRAPLQGMRGTFAADGTAPDAVFEVPAGALDAYVGKRIRHVVAIFDGAEATYVSPPADVVIVE